MVAVIIVSGAAVTALQQYERKWVKETTVLLGAIEAIIGGLKATLFAIDYRTYDQVIPQIEETIKLLQGEFQEYEKVATSDIVRAGLLKKLSQTTKSLWNSATCCTGLRLPTRPPRARCLRKLSSRVGPTSQSKIMGNRSPRTKKRHMSMRGGKPWRHSRIRWTGSWRPGLDYTLWISPR